MLFLILLLIAAAFLYPYAWAVFHRARTIRRLEQKGKQAGFRLRRFYGFPALTRNFSSRYDFYLEGADTVCLVKLFSAYHRGRTLVIGADGRLAERRSVHPPMEPNRTTPRRTEMTGRRRALSVTRKPKRNFRGKHVMYVLLNVPTYEKAVRVTPKGEVRLYDGSDFFDKKWYTPRALEKLLFENGEVSDRKAEKDKK